MLGPEGQAGGNWGGTGPGGVSYQCAVRFSGDVNLPHSDFKKHVCFDISPEVYYLGTMLEISRASKRPCKSVNVSVASACYVSGTLLNILFT